VAPRRTERAAGLRFAVAGRRYGPVDGSLDIYKIYVIFHVVMFANKTRVLLVLPQEVVDQARVFAGRATITLKLPVSLQIVLRALIEEGLKGDGHSTLLANVEGQVKAVRHIRKVARQGRRVEGGSGDRKSERRSRPSRPEHRRRRK
jgi:hypothetical protein